MFQLKIVPLQQILITMNIGKPDSRMTNNILSNQFNSKLDNSLSLNSNVDIFIDNKLCGSQISDPAKGWVIIITR